MQISFNVFRIAEHQIAPTAESAASGKVPGLVLVIGYFMMDSDQARSPVHRQSATFGAAKVTT